MLNIEDKSHMPDIGEIEAYIDNEVFGALHGRMLNEFAPVCSIEYSGDKVLLGWNVKYKKAVIKRPEHVRCAPGVILLQGKLF